MKIFQKKSGHLIAWTVVVIVVAIGTVTLVTREHGGIYNLSRGAGVAVSQDRQVIFTYFDGLNSVFLYKGKLVNEAVTDITTIPITTTDPMFPSGPAFSRDGSRIVFVSSYRVGSSDDFTPHGVVYTISASGGVPVRISDKNEQAYVANFSADGKSIYYLAGERSWFGWKKGLFIRNIDGSNKRKLVSLNSEFSADSLPLSPHDKYVILGNTVHSLESDVNQRLVNLGPSWHEFLSDDTILVSTNTIYPDYPGLYESKIKETGTSLYSISTHKVTHISDLEFTSSPPARILETSTIIFRRISNGSYEDTLYMMNIDNPDSVKVILKDFKPQEYNIPNK